MFDRFMDNYAHWDASNQFNFAVVIVAVGFLLTLLLGLWVAHLWKLYWHYRSICRVGWPGGPIPSSNLADDPHRVQIEAVRMTTRSQAAEAKLVGAAQQTLTREAEDNDNDQHEAEPRPAKRLSPAR